MAKRKYHLSSLSGFRFLSWLLPTATPPRFWIYRLTTVSQASRNTLRMEALWVELLDVHAIIRMTYAAWRGTEMMSSRFAICSVSVAWEVTDRGRLSPIFVECSPW